jgi:flavin-binding protein dodecin
VRSASFWRAKLHKRVRVWLRSFGEPNVLVLSPAVGWAILQRRRGFGALSKEVAMSVYKVVEIIGTSTESWEDAGLTAVKKARETIRQLRVAEVVEQDLDLDDSGSATFRTKLRVSFKYEDEG